MQHSPAFNKGRAIVFFITTLISLTWIVLLSVVAYARWDLTDHSERTFIALTILTNVLVVIMLPILMLVKFRPWLDAARMAMLLVTNFAVAICYAIWYPSFGCPGNSTTSMCRDIGMIILALIWVVPTLLLFYTTCLGIFIYTRTHTSPSLRDSSSTTSEHKQTNPENAEHHLSVMTAALPLHPSWVATGVPHSPSSPSSAAARHPSWPLSAESSRRTSSPAPAPAPAPGTYVEWDSKPRFPGGYPMYTPPPPASPSYASFDPNVPFDPYVGIAHPVHSMPPQAVSHPSRLSAQRYISNRMSHISELVDIARSETGSGAGEWETAADAERHRRKLAKTSRVYERAVIM